MLIRQMCTSWASTPKIIPSQKIPKAPAPEVAMRSIADGKDDRDALRCSKGIGYIKI